MIVSEEKKWEYAIGMAKVDGLEPSAELLELIKKEKNGEITTKEVKEKLYQKYG